ncbi:MAG: hypothetical protein ACM3X7_01720 [Solirubrobacterales bacterium]
MNINRAIRKQNKSYKRFVLSMCFVFFAMPVFPIVYKKTTPFYLTYLAIIEVLILLSIIIKSNKERLYFTYKTGKIILKSGLVLEPVKILCSKVLYVDIEKTEGDKSKFQDFKIILLSNSRFRTKKSKIISNDFLKRHTLAAFHYKKFKERQPENEYYYIIISSGGLGKYSLLNTIYKGCVNAGFSEEAIEKIKLYRDNI